MTQLPDSSSSSSESSRPESGDTTRNDQARLAQLSLDVSIALTRGKTLRTMLALCTDALVRHLDAAFARIWTLSEDGRILELQASSGIYTHLNGDYARVPVGQFKIGLIAEERRPHLTNAVGDDERIHDQAWARREGLVSFAGYPLLVEERLVGVVAMFARHTLSELTLQAMEALANSIALGIEQVRGREALQRNKRHLDLALRVGKIGTFEWNFSQDRLFWTPELESLYGLPRGTFAGTLEQWLTLVHPDDAGNMAANLQEAIAAGSSYQDEFRILQPDGIERWLLAKGEITLNKEGQPLRLTGVNIDISEHKEDERRVYALNQELKVLNANLEAQVAERTEVLHKIIKELERSNQELQDFAYVASHDLQEPLRKIQAFGNLLEEEYGQELADGKTYLDRMRNAAGRMRVLIEDLLAFSRVTTRAQPFSRVDLNEVARQVVDDLEARLRSNGGIIAIGALPTIDADPLQMYQMLQNLISNALKFQRPDVAPRVKVSATLLPVADGSAKNPENEGDEESRQNEQCVLTVEDNGIGFDEKYVDRIFTVFQRLHGRNEYEGTGIGLAVVRKIVERHEGTIVAHSVIGVGSTFIVTLPIHQKEIG